MDVKQVVEGEISRLEAKLGTDPEMESLYRALISTLRGLLEGLQ